jgi:tetratricopeptide (TPR) repeat protein
VPDAVTLHEENLRLQEAKLGPDHPTTFDCRNNLGLAYGACGRHEDAVRLIEMTLKRDESTLGPDHPSTLVSRGNLADAYSLLGDFARAEPLYRDALEGARKRFGRGNPDTSDALAKLGRNLLMQEKWSEAEPLLRDCLQHRVNTRPDDWSRFNAESLLGGVLLGQGKYAEAEPLLVRGYEGLKAGVPAQAEGYLTEAGERLVRLYEKWGIPGKAAEWRSRIGLEDPNPRMPNGAAAFEP